jgi:hypothetical protein
MNRHSLAYAEKQIPRRQKAGGFQKTDAAKCAYYAFGRNSMTPRARTVNVTRRPGGKPAACNHLPLSRMIGTVRRV